MSDHRAIAQRYVDTWNETDPQRRRALVDDLYTTDGVYTDPNVELSGPARIDAFVDDIQRQFPGYRFTLGDPVDGHHAQVRFNWHAYPPGATEPAYVGFDVLVLRNGRVRDVYGFIDRTPNG